MATSEIRITGFGGQGVILCGYIIGKAASIFSNQHATMTQSFGPEARGSACSSQVLISDDRVLYPYVTAPDIMIAISQDGYMTNRKTMGEKCVLIYEKDMVKPTDLGPKMKAFGIPATRLAEQLGRKIVLNIVMLGFFGAVTGVVPREALRKAVETSVPEGTQEFNLKAFDMGYDYATQMKTEEVNVK